MDVQLQRHISIPSQGTFGTLTVEGTKFCTVEKPWADNRPMVSCIPAGTYVCKRVDSPKFGPTFEVTDVIGRTHILFHAANIADELHGCIGIGSKFGVVYNRWAVTRSKDALAEFFELTLGWDEFTLEVKDGY